jgi:isochorismate hydrolase
MSPRGASSRPRDAAFFDYYPVVLSDAVASLDPKLHEASLYLMASRVDVATSADVITTWRSQPFRDRAKLLSHLSEHDSQA